MRTRRPVRSSISSRRRDLKVHIIKPDRWAGVVADRLNNVGKRGSKLCLPTGSTPKPAYRQLAAAGDLSRSTVFLLDEFVLPDGSEARCDSMLSRDLLDHMAHPPLRVQTWDTNSADLPAECERMHEAIGGRFDVAVLGIGMNGHLGLNEPGSPVTSQARMVELHTTTQDASVGYGVGPRPDQGVTFGLAELMDSAAVWLLATGAHKASIVGAALAGPITTSVPASVLQQHPNLEVFLDPDAATAL